jgi:hypothetical protein
MTGTKILLLSAFAVYLVLGSLTARYWRQHTRREHPATIYSDPDAWLAYWLPLVIATQIYALVGAGAFSIGMFAAGHLLDGPDGQDIRLTLIIGLPGIAVLFAAFDVAWFIQARRLARRQRQFGQIEQHDSRPSA